jgi:hypothetical protein
MKIYPTKFNLALFIGVAMITAIFITRPAHSQEPAAKEGKKIIKIKIVTEEDGKTTMVDTVMEMPDSASMDSIQDEIDKIIVIGKDGKHSRIRHRNQPYEFDYQFSMPDIEKEYQFDLNDNLENLDKLERLKDIESRLELNYDLPDCRDVRIGKDGGQTLNDVLGDIPMDRVTNYSIKNTKHGKRIVIETENGPFYEKDRDVVIIREPGRRTHRPHSSQYRMKVIRHSDADTKQEKVEDVPDVPSPPPPPPPDKKEGKSHSEAPKI